MESRCLAAALVALGLALDGAAFAQASAPAPSAESRVVVPPPGCRPQFPVAALRAGAHGVSRIAFQLDAAGKVTGAEVVGPSGPTREHRMLDQAALEGLSGCPFNAVRDAKGQPTAGVVTVNYSWRIE